VAGLAIAGGIAMAAGRTGSLAPSGRWGAVIVGTMATIAGWGWAALLVGWFVASSALTRLGQAEKAKRTAGALAPSSARTAIQVGANGSLFAVGALVGTVSGDANASVMALGALAAAAADTWATELGVLWGGPPRALFGGGRIAPGMSGGVTAVGLLASVAGSTAVGGAGAMLVPSLPWGSLAVAVATAGVLGGLADSALGATVQARRWCATCAKETERQMHDCGTRTTHARGLRWMTNDTVNLLATLVGALAALALSGLLF
jgi:uncharacterized protein (TIGR00297 family)